MRARTSFSALTVFVLFALSSRAQTNPNLAIGLTPYQSYDNGNIDSVSLLNGNLSVNIPLFSYPQRGSLTARYAITYNDKNWFVSEQCKDTESPCVLTWHYASWNPGGIAIVFLPKVSVGFAPLIPHQVSATIFTAQTTDGASHLMLPDNAGGYRTIDGSGVWNNGATTQGPWITKSHDGITFASSNGTLTVEDTNGNLYDSLGRIATGSTPTTDFSGCVVPPLPAQISSASIMNLPGQNGLTRNIKICTATYNISFNTGSLTTNDSNQNSDTINPGSATVNLTVSVVPYNGTSWTSSPAWGFNYSSAGSLTLITLPTGGTISYGWGDLPQFFAHGIIRRLNLLNS